LVRDKRVKSAKPALHQGRLTFWQDKRGFGFIKPVSGGRLIFLHISAVKDASRRPQVGDVIHYQLVITQDRKKRACNAFIEGARTNPLLRIPQLNEFRSKPTARSAVVLEALILSIVPVIGSVHFSLTTANPIPLGLYPIMSWLTFTLYANDKSRAKQGKWRIPENTLHLCELTGGWLGAFVAQRCLRHKSRKYSYQLIYWMIVVVHLAFWIYWLFWGRTLIYSLALVSGGNQIHLAFEKFLNFHQL
jgi:uncharacterized membrane protein YsdA (DUF1294 family)/cold shock CspA family protein